MRYFVSEQKLLHTRIAINFKISYVWYFKASDTYQKTGSEFAHKIDDTYGKCEIETISISLIKIEFLDFLTIFRTTQILRFVVLWGLGLK